MRKLKVFLKNIFSIPYRMFFTKVSITAVLQDSIVNRKAAICGNTKFYRSSIGKYSYVGSNSFVNNTYIGAFTSIAGNCYIGGTSHPMEWVSTSSVFHGWKNIFSKNFSKHGYNIFEDTYIGNDVWIGEGCKIKAGITIGDGAIIGMGSIVTKCVEPYAIYVGNPARYVRSRFDEDVIDKLLSSCWWTWEDKKIEQYADLFQYPEQFIKEFKQYEK